MMGRGEMRREQIAPSICPACDGQLDAMLFDTWGRPTIQGMSLPVQPFICAWCQTLFLIDLRTKTLTRPGPEEIAILQTNAVLWEAITRAQAELRQLPNRRKARP